MKKILFVYIFHILFIMIASTSDIFISSTLNFLSPQGSGSSIDPYNSLYYGFYKTITNVINSQPSDQLHFKLLYTGIPYIIDDLQIVDGELFASFQGKIIII